MNSDLEALDGTVKTVAKESTVALSFEGGSAYEVCGLREMLRICLSFRGLLKLSFYFSKAKWKMVVPEVAPLSKVSFFKVIFAPLSSIVRVASLLMTFVLMRPL